SCYAFGVNCPMGFSQASTRCTGFQYFEAGSGTQRAAAQFDAGDYAINAVSNNANVNSGSSIRVVFRNNDLLGWKGTLRSYSVDAQSGSALPFGNFFKLIRERNELSLPAQSGLQTWPRRN